MASYFNDFTTGGIPENGFPGQTSGVCMFDASLPALSNDIFFGAPVKNGVSGVSPNQSGVSLINDTSDNILGFAKRVSNREFQSSQPPMSYTFAEGDMINFVYVGIIYLRCQVPISRAAPVLFMIAKEGTPGDGSVGLLTTSNIGALQARVIPVSDIVRPLENSGSSPIVKCFVNTNFM